MRVMQQVRASVAVRRVVRLSNARFPHAASEKVTETGQRRKRIKGKLARITSMPTDVFMEVCLTVSLCAARRRRTCSPCSKQIASYLAPLDILHLSRSSRHIRIIFMSKNSAFVWRVARKNLRKPLPDVPEVIERTTIRRAHV